MDDAEYMRQALEAAREVKGHTAPNPAVGAVIVRDGTVLGRGATSPAGGNHAEINALAAAGAEGARGADIYVTLEPCSHYGRTPPCTEALIAAGVRRVICACTDPNPQVSGRGLQQLRGAGIIVDVGEQEAAARRLNEDFFHYIRTGRPWVSVKLAMTLDGKIADKAGVSKWITGDAARQRVHHLRGMHSAIAVGANTLRSDNPRLNVRHGGGADPIRILFFSGEPHLQEDSYLFQSRNDLRTIAVVTGSGLPRRKETTSEGIEVWHTGSTDPVDSVGIFCAMAGQEEIDSLFLEGGSGLISSFMEAEMINRYYLFYAPKILGGGFSGLVKPHAHGMDDILCLEDVVWEQLGPDMLVTGRVPQQTSCSGV
ncbi:MAG: bifunctional diaminohydroxyphosphoribosylaminopyrimidine deaminase/5-amino-6-(5-phosphoribosylamino)uracil reductase RibD [Fibrobacterota bacterium]